MTWVDSKGIWENFKDDFHRLSTTVSGDTKVKYKKQNIDDIIVKFEYHRLKMGNLCTRLEKAAQKMMTTYVDGRYNNNEELGKGLTGMANLLKIPDGLAIRPPIEQACELDTWGIVPPKGHENASKIYPNKKAPSDHPPYIVEFSLPENQKRERELTH